VVMVGRSVSVQAAEQVAQRPGAGAECRAAVAGESDRGDGHGPVPGLLAADYAPLLIIGLIAAATAAVRKVFVLVAFGGYWLSVRGPQAGWLAPAWYSGRRSGAVAARDSAITGGYLRHVPHVEECHEISKIIRQDVMAPVRRASGKGERRC
jgi:hypothetical protein